MPKGYPNPKPSVVIDIEPVQGRQRGQVEKLLVKYRERTYALELVSRLLAEEDTARALHAGPRRLLEAANVREAAAPTPPRRGRRAPRQGPVPKRRYRRREQYGIGGKAKTLFVLEHLSDEAYRTAQELIKDFQRAGYPIQRPLALNSTLGVVLLKRGYVRKNKEKGYQRTASGRRYAATLRAALEKGGHIPLSWAYDGAPRAKSGANGAEAVS